MALAVRVSWIGVLSFTGGIGLVAWGLWQVATDARPVLLRPNPNLVKARATPRHVVLATVCGAILATILARLTFADSTVAMALSIGGFAIFGFAMIVREVPGCSPLLARFAPAVAFAGWTIHGLPRQALSSAMVGAVPTSDLVFDFQAWRSRQR